jgi:hypothetical protein
MTPWVVLRWRVLAGTALLTSIVVASAGAFVLRRQVVSGGAVREAAGSFLLRGTVGEPAVGAGSGGSFRLGGGFWSGMDRIPTTAISPDEGSEDRSDDSPLVITYENALLQNAPNPFGGPTVISFSVAQPGPVQMAIYDATGRRIATLAEGLHAAGQHRFEWAGRDDKGHHVAAGIYFCRVTIGSWSQTRKILKVE